MQAIHSLCYKYGIKADYYFKETRWTTSDLKILKENYELVGANGVYDLISGRHTLSAISTKAQKKFGFSKDRTWSEEENKILATYYPIEPITDVMKRLPNRTYQSIITHALKVLKLVSYAKSNILWDANDVKYIIDNWKSNSDIELANHLHCSPRRVQHKRFTLGLLRCKSINKASYYKLKYYIRSNMTEWKKESMRSCGYKCILTGSKDFHIHHLQSVSLMLGELIEEIGFNVKDKFEDYTEIELQYFLEKFLEKQSQYPLGECIRKDLHKEFHNKYGNATTPEMWEDFKSEYIKNNNNLN